MHQQHTKINYIRASSNLMSKKIAILQSNYIPWKGYFDLMNWVDEFILYDDVQYTRRDWRNRNKIKTPNGLVWLTIPVRVKGRYDQKINQTVIRDESWKEKHWRQIIQHYSKSKYFHEYYDLFEELYLGCDENYLSKINYRFLEAICKILGITTKLSWSMDYQLSDGKTKRLVDLCKQAQATEYISGPAAKAYLDEALFDQEAIHLQYMDYANYPSYTQLYPPFEHNVSVIDLIFNEGPNASQYMLHF